MITYDESSSHLDGKLMKIQQISKHQSIGMAQVVAVHQLKIADCVMGVSRPRPLLSSRCDPISSNIHQSL